MDAGSRAGEGGKYALVERERRFLLDAVPAGTPVRTVEIVDRYLDRCRIRLRVATIVRGEGSGAVRHKLTQKIPAQGGRPALITTLYLDPAEQRVFDALPGALLRKTRLSFPPFGVDVFRGSLSGLVLAEAEFDSSEEMARCGHPAWAGPEVTCDPAFSGGRLARATKGEVDLALGRYGRALPA